MTSLTRTAVKSLLWRGSAALIVVAVSGVALLVAGALQYLGPEVPDVASLKDVRLQIPLRIYSRDGKLLSQIGEQRRIPLAYEALPKQLVNAFLAAEDDRFFEHHGVDYEGLARAVAVNLVSGAKREGGGTITMQLARNMFLSPERSYRRKMLEIISAWRIEHSFTKQEILALYLNKIFLGQRAYGVGAAAEVYFGKTVDALTLPEIALLAGLPRAPSRENPVTSPTLAKLRRAYVLRRMSELNFITASERTAAEIAPVESELHGVDVDMDAPFIAEMARLELEQRFGQRIYTDNFAVFTTVDSRLQQAAIHALRVGLLEYDSRHGYRGPAGHVDLSSLRDDSARRHVLAKYPSVGGLVPGLVVNISDQQAQILLHQDQVTVTMDNLKWARTATQVAGEEPVLGKLPTQPSDVLALGDVVYVAQLTSGAWRLLQVPQVQAAMVALDPGDGAIVALEGGFDFNASRFNRAVQAARQPGSSFKPYLYSSALDNGFTPASIVNDSPMVVDDGTDQGSWRPQNTNLEFMGPMRLREALVKSRNLVSIRLISGLGTDYVTQYIKRFGFTDAQVPPNLSLALGATQVTPLDQARGYAVFANGGKRIEPYLIDRVVGGEGQLVYAAHPAIACEECDSPGPYRVEETATTSQRVAAGNSDSNADATSPAISATSFSAAPISAAQAPRVITATNAFLMTDMMKDVIRRGTATRARVLNRRDIAGKTGTTNDRRDTWFVGFNADIVAATWVGFDQERPLGQGEEGGRTALPIWVYFMQQALKGTTEHSLPQPEGIVSMRISADSGRPTTRTGSDTLFEYFDKAHMPDSQPEAEMATPDSSPSGGGDSLF